MISQRTTSSELNEKIVLEVISKELKIKRMFIQLPEDGKVSQIIFHLKETFKILNLKDYYVKEIIDKIELKSIRNRELNFNMPLCFIESGIVSVEKRYFCDCPRLYTLKNEKPKDSQTKRSSRKKSSLHLMKLTLNNNKIISVS